MWLRSVFLKTLRDYRIPILGWGIGMGFVVVSPMASVATLLTTPQARAQLVSLAATFAWNADVVAVDTIGGHATFLLLIWFFISFIGPELKWPDATLRLSPFYYYGTPLLHGLSLTSVLAVLAATALALGLSAFRFVRKDIGV